MSAGLQLLKAMLESITVSKTRRDESGYIYIRATTEMKVCESEW